MTVPNLSELKAALFAPDGEGLTQIQLIARMHAGLMADDVPLGAHLALVFTLQGK